MTPKFGNALLASTLVCLILTTAQAQSNSGSIVGTIKNTGGEVISGAQITVTQVQTNKQFSAMTNSEGYYEVISKL